MTQRERTLALLVGVIFGSVVLYKTYFWYVDAVQQRTTQLAAVKSTYNDVLNKDKYAKRVQTLRKKWEKLSLPANPKVASNDYQEWLSKLADRSSLKKTVIDARPTTDSAIKNFEALSVTFTARGTLEQLIHFMHGFAVMNRLQEIRNMTVTPDKSNELVITMAIEALILPATQNKELPNEISPLMKDIDLASLKKEFSARNFFADYTPPRVERPLVQTEQPKPAPPPLKFDASKTTFVTGLTDGPEGAQVWITIRTRDKTIKPFEGDEIEVEGQIITVLRINQRDVEFKLGEKKFTVEYGQSLADGLQGKEKTPNSL